MARILFILGRPGSGKSTAARKIEREAQHKGLSPIRLNDYDILYNMFLSEQHHPNDELSKFRRTVYKGFDVLDFSVLKIALLEIEKKARKYMLSPHKLVFIEFARDNYLEALRLFQDDFLCNASFLFIQADVEVCIKRVHARSTHPHYDDDHFVSDEIIRNYYRQDCTPEMIAQLEEVYSLSEGKVSLIYNTGSWDRFLDDVGVFAHKLFCQLDDTKPRAKRTTQPLSTDIVANRRITMPEFV